MKTKIAIVSILFCVSCVHRDSGLLARKAYYWELRAQQINALFEQDMRSEISLTEKEIIKLIRENDQVIRRWIRLSK